MNLSTLRDDVSSISTLEQMAGPMAQYALEMTTTQLVRKPDWPKQERMSHLQMCLAGRWVL